MRPPPFLPPILSRAFTSISMGWAQRWMQDKVDGAGTQVLIVRVLTSQGRARRALRRVYPEVLRRQKTIIGGGPPPLI